MFQFSAFKGFFCVVFKFKFEYIIFYQMMRLFWYFSWVNNQTVWFSLWDVLYRDFKYRVYMKYMIFKSTYYDKREILKSSLNFQILNILHYFVTKASFHLLFLLWTLTSFLRKTDEFSFIFYYNMDFPCD